MATTISSSMRVKARFARGLTSTDDRLVFMARIISHHLCEVLEVRPRQQSSSGFDSFFIIYSFGDDMVDLGRGQTSAKPNFMHIQNEHYHIYNRGAHKAPIFLDGSDYWRFIALLYLANNTSKLSFKRMKPDQMFSCPRSDLVNIFAYCLMPNHFHLGLVEKTKNGIEIFMRKLCTAYVMYYNKKYDHSGTIFQGAYKEKHVDNDDYLRYLIQYIHLNPYGIEEPELMKTAKTEYLQQAIEYSKKYTHSSYMDYLGTIRPQTSIITKKINVEA